MGKKGKGPELDLKALHKGPAGSLIQWITKMLSCALAPCSLKPCFSITTGVSTFSAPPVSFQPGLSINAASGFAGALNCPAFAGAAAPDDTASNSAIGPMLPERQERNGAASSRTAKGSQEQRGYTKPSSTNFCPISLDIHHPLSLAVMGQQHPNANDWAWTRNPRPRAVARLYQLKGSGWQLR